MKVSCDAPGCTSRRKFNDPRAHSLHLYHSTKCGLWYQENLWTSARDDSETDSDASDEDENVSEDDFAEELASTLREVRGRLAELNGAEGQDLPVPAPAACEGAASQQAEPFFDKHPTAGAAFGEGATVFEGIASLQQFVENRKSNKFYPFKCQDDWEVAEWLIKSRLPMSWIDNFLKLSFVSRLRAIK